MLCCTHMWLLQLLHTPDRMHMPDMRTCTNMSMISDSLNSWLAAACLRIFVKRSPSSQNDVTMQSAPSLLSIKLSL